MILRSRVRSDDRNRFLAVCWVIEEPPWVLRSPAALFISARRVPTTSMPK